MRKVAAASLFLFSTMAWSELPPPDIQRIINQADEHYSNCRGGTGGTDPDTNPYCIKGRELFENLEKLGWCYGHEGQYGNERTWEPCVSRGYDDNEQSAIDFDKSALEMYSTYMNYRNGVAAMMGKETECWNSVVGLNSANQCAASVFIAGIIEVSYAQEQGRTSAPNYQPAMIRERIIKQFSNHGFSEAQASSAISYVAENMNKVIAGLMNAGMN